MESQSLGEAVLFGLAEESGIEPDGDLLERIDAAPPAARRRAAREDAEVFRICAVTPVELSAVLVDLVENALTDEGRVDPDAAWAAVQAVHAEPREPDATVAPERSLTLLHAALGLGEPCQECRDWQPEDAGDADDDAPSADDASGGDARDDDDHPSGPPSVLERIYTVHEKELDTWQAQVALRIAAQSGESLGEISGFHVLHQVVGHGAPAGIDREERADLHDALHVGMALCEDVAHIHTLRLAHGLLGTDGSVAEALDRAEVATAEDTGVLSAVLAAVIVDRIAPIVDQAISSAPPAGPPRTTRTRRRGR